MDGTEAPTRRQALAALLRPERRTRVVEVGANPINDNPYGALLDDGLVEVWGFEPNPTAFARLTPGPNETYLPYAVGDGATRTLNLTRSVSMSSLLEPETATHVFLQRLSRPMTVEGRPEMETKRLDDMNEIPGIDLLKIDVQGGEMLVYDGAARRLDGAAMVITEVAFLPLYKDQPLLDAQMIRMRDHGLAFHKFLHLKGMSLRGPVCGALEKRAHRNQLVDGDAVFLRDLSRPDEIPTETLKHLALLCDGVIQSFDFTLRCLDLLIGRGAIDEEATRGYVAALVEMETRRDKR